MYCGLMSNAAKEYLDDIKSRKKDLMKQLKELRDLERAIRSAGKIAETGKDNPVKPNKAPTLKDMVLAVLHALNRGAEALEIVSEIKATYDKDVMRSSLSPQLSRLKAEGKLILDDKVWYLPHIYTQREEKLILEAAVTDSEIINEHVEGGASNIQKIKANIDAFRKSQSAINWDNVSPPRSGPE